MLDLAVITFASAFAGFIDAIVGGGGLILVPALFSTYPNAVPATLLGTNKATSIWGTAMAGLQFARRVRLPWKALAPAAVVALLGSLLGAWVLTHVDAGGMRKALPLILLAVLGYTLWKKEMGIDHAPHRSTRAQAALMAAIGLSIGFYDGFFGPGAGSFFVFALVRLLRFDFLNASACAKVLNTATNAAALVLLAAKGHVWWHVAAVTATANVLGSLAGTRVAMRRGAGFVRGVFLLVVSALILKTGWDAFGP